MTKQGNPYRADVKAKVALAANNRIRIVEDFITFNRFTLK
jgi:hypothetical protein